MALPEWLRLRRAQPIPAEDAAQWTKCPKCGSMIYRPDLGVDPERAAAGNSLPSGHTTIAASVAVALVLVVPSKARGPAPRSGPPRTWPPPTPPPCSARWRAPSPPSR